MESSVTPHSFFSKFAVTQLHLTIVCTIRLALPITLGYSWRLT